MLAYIFVVEGFGKIAGYASLAECMSAHGVDSRPLPVVILTELGGGLFVLFGLKLADCVVLRTGSERAIQLQKNVAMAGAFLALTEAGPGAWSLDGRRARAL
jgi:putative oxidoreductase